MKISKLSLKLLACAVFLCGNSYFAFNESKKIQTAEFERHQRETIAAGFTVSGSEPESTVFDYVGLALLIPALACTIAVIWLREH